jgi:hypothetical protein
MGCKASDGLFPGELQSSYGRDVCVYVFVGMKEIATVTQGFGIFFKINIFKYY